MAGLLTLNSDQPLDISEFDALQIVSVFSGAQTVKLILEQKYYFIIYFIVFFAVLFLEPDDFHTFKNAQSVAGAALALRCAWA